MSCKRDLQKSKRIRYLFQSIAASVLLFAGSIHAQAVLWNQLVYGRMPAGVVSQSSTVDPAGNIVLAARVGDQSSSNSPADLLVVKYFALNGAKVWQRRMELAKDNIPVAIVSGPSGDIYVLSDLSDDSTTSALLTAFSGSTGDVLWQQAQPTSFSGGLAIGQDGNPVISFVSLGPAGTYPVSAAKYSNAGVPIWSQTLADTSYPNANFLGVDATGAVLVAKSAGSSGILSKLDSGSGASIWTVTTTSFTRMTLGSGGEIISAGLLAGTNGARVEKRSPADGAFIWGRDITCLGSVDYSPRLRVAAGGDVTVAVREWNTTPTRACITTMASVDGAIVSAPKTAGSDFAYINDIAFAADGSLVAVGATPNGPPNFSGAARVARYSTIDGTMIWQGAAPTQPSVEAYQVAVSATSVFAIEYAGSSGVNNVNLVRHLLVDGSFSWQTILGGFEEEKETIPGSVNGPPTSFDPLSYRYARADAAGNVTMTGTLLGGFQGNYSWVTNISADGQVRWNRRYGFGGGKAVAIGPSGQIFVASDQGYNGATTMKLDSISGNALWSANLPNGPVRDIAVDGNGDVIVAGGMSKQIVKYNGVTGAEIWSQTIPSGIAFSSVKVDNAGNVVVAGAVNGSPTTTAKVIKFNGVTGGQVWEFVQSGAWFHDLVLDSAGNAYATGYKGAQFSGTAFALRISGSTGAVDWSRDLPVGNAGRGYSLQLDSMANLLVLSFADTGAGYLPVVSKLNGTSGATLWQQYSAITAATSAQGHHLALDPSDNVIIAGQAVQGTYDWLIRKVDGRSGAVLWTSNYAGTANGTDIAAVVLPASGTVTVVGFSSELAFGKGARVIKLANGPQPPLEPQQVIALAGDQSAEFYFAPPDSDGGSPVLGYTVSCLPGMNAASSVSSPITLPGLTNGTTYSCQVTAANALGTGAASQTVSVTPLSMVLLRVESRMVHGSTGMLALQIDRSKSIGQAVTVEPRAIGAGHQLVFVFSAAVSTIGLPTAVDSGGQPVEINVIGVSGAEVTVSLPGVQNRKRVQVTVPAVNSVFDAIAAMGFLLGDVGGTGAVTAADIAAVKARTNRPLTATTLKFDVDTSGHIDAADASLVKAYAGTRLE